MGGGVAKEPRSAFHNSDLRAGFGTMGGQAMLLLFKKECPGFDVHRLRATFSDWAGDKGYPAELREFALAHAVGDAVQQTYNQGDRKELRRKMMQHWDAALVGFCYRRVMTKEKKPDYAFGNYHADMMQDDPDDVQVMTPEENAKAAEKARKMMAKRDRTLPRPR